MADEKNSPVDKADTGKNDNNPEGNNPQGKNEDGSNAFKFKYKTQEEAEKAYVELERKFGEHSKEVEEARKLYDQTDTMLRAIWSDPDTYRQVESAVKKYVSGESLPERKIPKSAEDKGEEKADKNERNDPQFDDLRMAEENRVLGDFFTKYGYNSLSEKDRKESYQRLVVSLAEIFDPGGKKPIKQILSEVPLSKLSRYLEHAHFIANKDQMIEKARQKGAISQEENNAAAIGSFSSDSKSRGETVTMTSEERKVAERLGVSEEKYLKRKAESLKEAQKYNR